MNAPLCECKTLKNDPNFSRRLCWIDYKVHLQMKLFHQTTFPSLPMPWHFTVGTLYRGAQKCCIPKCSSQAWCPWHACCKKQVLTPVRSHWADPANSHPKPSTQSFLPPPLPCSPLDQWTAWGGPGPQGSQRETSGWKFDYWLCAQDNFSLPSVTASNLGFHAVLPYTLPEILWSSLDRNLRALFCLTDRENVT